jgi:hypothetical protein
MIDVLERFDVNVDLYRGAKNENCEYWVWNLTINPKKGFKIKTGGNKSINTKGFFVLNLPSKIHLTLVKDEKGLMGGT